MRNHPLAVTLLALCLTVAAAASIAALSRPAAKPAGETAQVYEAESESQSAAEDYSYLLGQYDGKLAVFEKDKTEPHMVFDIYVHSLPDYDKGQLEQGIKVKDYDALVLLIEDYIS